MTLQSLPTHLSAENALKIRQNYQFQPLSKVSIGL
jgi:hypothetical protein